MYPVLCQECMFRLVPGTYVQLTAFMHVLDRACDQCYVEKPTGMVAFYLHKHKEACDDRH